jgi:hypothetical protein
VPATESLNHIIAAMVAGGAWLFAGIGVLISVLIWVHDSAAPLPAALDREEGVPSWIGVVRDANVSLFRGGAGTAHGAAIYGIFQRHTPRGNRPKVESSIRRGPIVSQEIITPVRASLVPSSRERHSNHSRKLI